MQSKLLICLVTNIRQCSRMTDDSVPSFVGYGLGGLKGVKGLPDQLCDRVFYFNVDSSLYSSPLVSRQRGRKKNQEDAWDS